MSSRARSANTLQERVANGRLLEAAFGPAAAAVFERVEAVHIVACGTSYHAGVVAQLLHRADLPHALPRRRSRANIATAIRWCRKNALFVIDLAVG